MLLALIHEICIRPQVCVAFFGECMQCNLYTFSNWCRVNSRRQVYVEAKCLSYLSKLSSKNFSVLLNSGLGVGFWWGGVGVCGVFFAFFSFSIYQSRKLWWAIVPIFFLSKYKLPLYRVCKQSFVAMRYTWVIGTWFLSFPSGFSFQQNILECIQLIC